MSNLPWKRAIIVGASSGIGEALARRLGQAGCKMALVARREQELQDLATQINAQAGSDIASCYKHDVTDTASVNELFGQIVQDLGGLDLIIYAAGIMPAVAPDEYNIEKDLQTIAINFTGAVAWLNEAAYRFGKLKAGTIVGISSVAGERGRRKNVVYGATKAALNTYLESLRNRVSRYGVAVITALPGPVDTPMTKSVGKMPGMIPADEAAALILTAAQDKVNVAFIPGKWRVIMGVIRAIPHVIFKHLDI